jgi:hypothetical protein
MSVLMPRNNINLIRKYAKKCKTKERFKELVLSLKVLGNSNDHMAEVTLDGYWAYYNELEPAEQRMRDVTRFVHGYVSKHIQDKLFS